MMSPRPAIDRFLEKFYVDDGGCWIWTACRFNGYAYMYFGGRPITAYRFAYEYFIAPIPPGLVLDHVCNRGADGCVNPYHCVPVTSGQNAQRNSHTRKTECPAGHPYDELNTYVDPKGHRRCRRCAYESLRRTRARKQAAT